MLSGPRAVLPMALLHGMAGPSATAGSGSLPGWDGVEGQAVWGTWLKLGSVSIYLVLLGVWLAYGGDAGLTFLAPFSFPGIHQRRCFTLTHFGSPCLEAGYPAFPRLR